ncbi:DUF1592 domain-containing protein [Paraliomyxa miuraensis]|uniref:DUF1592 domain-containing protein n=1 Tax=Paraliomyxa miuraensis TaxID=376150 RepID=UPI00225950D7|nr:DUF1592 domain-containing protein [Paraliomyxa miuraensis]MCX4245205.1 DUF1592 domain-containing protein [Paraliomyxa miuraensis]
MSTNVHATWGLVLVGLLATGCRDRNGEGEADDDGLDTVDPDDGGGDGVAARCEDSRVGPPLLRRLTRNELQATIEAAFPELLPGWPGVAVGPDPVSKLGFGNDAQTLVVGNQTADELLETAQDAATRLVASGTLEAMLPCAASSPDAGCATELVEQRGAALFRRPLNDEEIARYVEHFDSIASRSDFATGIRWTLVAMMQSPQMVYRSELGQRDGDVYRLDPYEIASSLSYDFAGQPPDEILLARAEAGELQDPAARIEEARRLLATTPGGTVLRRFFREWVGYGEVVGTVRAEEPEFEAVRGSMEEETRRFIDAVVYEDGGGVRELLTAPYTVLNDELAAFYGYGSPGGDFARVERPEQWARGLLAQGSLLAANAHTDASSPTLRGVLVFQRLLCNARLSPPADVPAIGPANVGAQTTRERYELAHAADPSCNVCHRLFDPIGFGFEHFDHVGRYRADESGLPIDATGNMLVDVHADPLTFDGLTELAEVAADAPEVTDCISGLMASYYYGGAGGETCLAEEARDRLVAEEIGLFEYTVQLAGTDHFVQRAAP